MEGKKQMMEVFSWVYQNKKSGKNRSTKGAVGYALLLAVSVLLYHWLCTEGAKLFEHL